MEEVLRFNNVSRFYHNRDKAAVVNLSFTIGAGEVVALLGHNGAGKTTTVKMASTLLVPSQGDIFVGGIDAVNQSQKARAEIGLALGGDIGFYMKVSALDNLVFFGHLQNLTGKKLNNRISEVLEMVGLKDVANQAVEGFSRGMKQRLHLARAILAEPKLVLLDEPSNGLDPQGARELKQLVRDLRQFGHGTLLTTHQMIEADELADKVLIISGGKLIACGNVPEIKQQAGLGEVTTLQIESSIDPAAWFKKLDNVISVQSLLRHGSWTVDVLWASGVKARTEFNDLIPEAEILYSQVRPASLEEAYLSFVDANEKKSCSEKSLETVN